MEVQQLIFSAWGELPLVDRATLGREMSLTGVAGEPYACTPDATEGPAFLVYYSPAFVKIAAHDHLTIALRMLAEIYRAARQLWPMRADSAGEGVTVHIGKLRGLKVVDDISSASYLKGQVWLLVQTSAQEAVVQLESISDAVSLAANGTPHVLLRFWAERWNESVDDETPAAGVAPAAGAADKV